MTQDKENVNDYSDSQPQIQMEVNKPVSKPAEDENIFALANAKPQVQDFDMPPLPKGKKAAPAQPASAKRQSLQRRPASLGNAGRQIMQSGS
jgi:hypothetical protein